jgi:PKHD-type hydroxylase
MSHKPLWYVKEIPAELCDLAIKDFLKVAPKDANMGQNGEVNNHEHRNTSIRFIDPGHWFTYLMHEVGREGNVTCRWQYEVNGQENLQFAEYGPNQHYDWHVDVFPLAVSPTDRKISIICLLSDPEEFEGGDLEIKLYSQYKAPLKKGTIIAFPSILEHRVTPVISGLRRSAVVWMTGPRFK